MARNYKRDRAGRFARVNSLAGKKAGKFAPAKMTGRERLALNARVAAPGVAAAVDGVRKLRAPVVKQHSATSRGPIPRPAKGNVIVAADGKGNVRPVGPREIARIRRQNRAIRNGAIVGGIVGGYAGAHAGIVGVGPGALIGTQIGARAGLRLSQRKRR
jgi:hypothetical protein